MPQSNGPAVDIDDSVIPVQFSAYGKALGRNGLIGFNKIKVLHGSSRRQCHRQPDY